MSMPAGSSLSEHEVLDKEFSFVDFVEDESPDFRTSFSII